MDYSPAMGRMERQTRTYHHQAVDAVEEQSYRETVAVYLHTGGKDVSGKVDVLGVKAQADRGEKETYWLYIPYTQEELQ